MSFTDSFIEKHRLPESFRQVAEHYVPLCAEVKQWIQDKQAKSDRPLVLGINGAQGTGKSTLADFIAESLKKSEDMEVAVLSIDDFYLTKAERQNLAENIHPLLATRGVPGTHDMPLAFRTLEMLMAGESAVPLPRFDKSVDDRADIQSWPSTEGKVDLIILEGWCVGSIPESSDSLSSAVNALEADEDKDCIWRNYVNDTLSQDYQHLFNLIDCLVMLKAPDFDCVYEWRLEQEKKLAEKVGEAEGIMTESQISRFIQHYERLTRQNLNQLPNKADRLLCLDRDHKIAPSSSAIPI